VRRAGSIEALPQCSLLGCVARVLHFLGPSSRHFGCNRDASCLVPADPS
jgi:hypothetical protein